LMLQPFAWSCMIRPHGKGDVEMSLLALQMLDETNTWQRCSNIWDGCLLSVSPR
jgi:hypothetical protein